MATAGPEPAALCVYVWADGVYSNVRMNDRLCLLVIVGADGTDRKEVLAGITRSTVYARRRPAATDETDLVLCRLMDDKFTRRPFYGSRRMVVFLKRQRSRIGEAPGQRRTAAGKTECTT